MGMVLGKWGQRRLKSLKRNRPDVYRQLKRSGELKEHLESVDQNAEEMFQTVLQRLQEKDPPPENDFQRKVGRMNALANQAEEFVMREIVLVPDAETKRAIEQGAYTD